MNVANFPEKRNIRRQNVVERLEYQLETGMKNTKDGKVPLTSNDVKRIERELKTLKQRVVSSARSKRTKPKRRL